VHATCYESTTKLFALKAVGAYWFVLLLRAFYLYNN